MYPVNLLLDDKDCLVLGGGAVACQKVGGLLAGRARVTIVAPTACPELKDLAAAGTIRWLKRPYEFGDEAGYLLIICASSDHKANKACAKAALDRGQLVNVCDEPALSNWAAPSVVRRGDLLYTIATNGKSPALSRWLRRQLEEDITPAYGQWLDRLASIRTTVREALPDSHARQEFWRTALTDEIMEDAIGGQMAAAEDALRQRLAQWPARKEDIHD